VARITEAPKLATAAAVSDPPLGGEATRHAWEGLQRQFLARLPARAERIRHAATPDDALAEWHRLAGVAGSYGHVMLGDLARRTLNACHAASCRILATALAEFDAVLQRLGMDSGVTVR
jgi:HPt (histidine-containing phosphotransfer) domain-containing protein